ncbi:hypothetical protein BJV74DRAFT_795749 [Russula compacta]|nr:hypothetical protein BJV74DRAFT_795749 [Russula compacta]
MARIDAHPVDILQITMVSQLIFDTPNLQKFVTSVADMMAAARVSCRAENGKKEEHWDVSEGKRRNEALRGRRFHDRECRDETRNESAREKRKKKGKHTEFRRGLIPLRLHGIEAMQSWMNVKGAGKFGFFQILLYEQSVIIHPPKGTIHWLNKSNVLQAQKEKNNDEAVVGRCRRSKKNHLLVKKDMRQSIPVEWPLSDDAVAVAIPARGIDRGRGLRCGFGLSNDGRDGEE